MKTLNELRYIDLDISSADLVFSRLDGLRNKNIDTDVFLPTKNMNLQRDHVWNHLQKQELIMSILMERPIPPVCIVAALDPNSTDDILQIIDGKQRLTAMMEYFDNKFTLELEGGHHLYKALPEDYRNAIAKYAVKCHMAYEYEDQLITDQTKIDWFGRINFAGTPQDDNHMKKLKEGR